MSTKFYVVDTVLLVEQRTARRWIKGTGKEAEFADDSIGWYAVFKSTPTSMYLGTTQPGLKAGDRVKVTVEKIT